MSEARSEDYKTTYEEVDGHTIPTSFRMMIAKMLTEGKAYKHEDMLLASPEDNMCGFQALAQLGRKCFMTPYAYEEAVN